MIDEKKILEICDQTANMVLNMQNEGNLQKGNIPLIFPILRNNKSRVSEQETRFQFSGVIEKKFHPIYYSDVYYSIETPTKHLYSFKNRGDKPEVSDKSDKSFISGQMDLTIYELQKENDEEKNDFERVWNVEFKAHNPNQASITKDFLKLFCEEPNGLFFHTLENAFSDTLPTLLCKFYKAIEYSEKFKNSSAEDKIILIYIVVLKTKKKHQFTLNLKNFDLVELKKEFEKALSKEIECKEKDIT